MQGGGDGSNVIVLSHSGFGRKWGRREERSDESNQTQINRLQRLLQTTQSYLPSIFAIGRLLHIGLDLVGCAARRLPLHLRELREEEEKE
jgi:hypothetical protein